MTTSRFSDFSEFPLYYIHACVCVSVHVYALVHVSACTQGTVPPGCFWKIHPWDCNLWWNSSSESSFTYHLQFILHFVCIHPCTCLCLCVYVYACICTGPEVAVLDWYGPEADPVQGCKLTLYGTSQPGGGFGNLLAQQEFHRPKLIKQIISQINLFSYFDHQTSIFHSISSFFSLRMSQLALCGLASSVCFRLLGGGSLTPSKNRHITITLHATCYYAIAGH